nr:uncharacterized protein LOC124808553 [Hydra vulgaris]
MAVTLVEIKKMIKDLFSKYKVETEAALKQQENNFINIVSANTKILNERLDKVEKSILENAKKISTLATEVEEIKETILKNSSKLKGKNIFINEDFCTETNRIREDLREKMKIERQSGKFAYISYDMLIVREWNAKKK